MNIILWIISALFSSIWWVYQKKAIENSNISTSLFSILWPIIWAFIIGSLMFILNISTDIYSNWVIILLTLLIVFLEIGSNFLNIYIYKKTKLSELLPYFNLDKLLIVLIGFFLFYWTKNSTSIESFIIILFTIIIVIWFSIDFKNLKINKNIWLFIFSKSISSISTLLIGYILIQYSAVEYMSINVIFTFILYFLILIITKDNVKILLKQTNIFYKSRFLWLILWWTSFILWLYIIQTSWVLIATLLSFIGLIFSIISMKLILNDNPNRKQIILAFIVMFMIWIWYYFK